MRSPARLYDNNDEEAPLFRAQCEDVDASYPPTQLATAQVKVLVLPWIAEAVVSNSMSPYINQVC
jgi:hypothetical protein